MLRNCSKRVRKETLSSELITTAFDLPWFFFDEFPIADRMRIVGRQWGTVLQFFLFFNFQRGRYVRRRLHLCTRRSGCLFLFWLIQQMRTPGAVEQKISHPHAQAC
ncbi:hypothetical protein T4D_12206 [Trichinella pseudospiralis]|uniref:Uncharacterized protein n=1 Tax=Trichinella pseudospiralis TaxID=6337 RepID=A0A0V1FEE2_TRIPS|nr:hypothetical protein T4D_12206 [Trichinella pseudospiralis]